MGLRFKGKNLALRATLFAHSKKDGAFALGGIMERPAGNFAINLPPGVFPIESDVAIPGNEDVDRLNGLGELMFILDGASWTFASMTIHELRVADERLHGKITVQLRRDALLEAGEEETAVITFKNQRVETLTDDDIERSIADVRYARDDTFDLAEGIGRMRWEDDRAALESNVNVSEWRSADSAKDPLGRKVRWPAGLEISHFLFRGGNDTSLWLSAFVRFGRDKKVAGLTLYPHPRVEGSTDEMLAWLKNQLALKGETDKWSRNGVTVALTHNEKGYVFSIDRMEAR